MRKNTLAKTLVVLTTLAGASAFAAHDTPASQAPPRHIDVVIALDTSSSMNGLIDSARQKLWDVVNVLSKARPQPIVRVGLLSYGNTGYDRTVGWVRKDSDLTTDLDGIYAKLFALRTNGGEEYVARAVKVGTEQMQWDQDQKTLKIIFVAGNEPANQDPLVNVESAVQAAREKGIFVNTIYCGSQSNGEASLWSRVATLGGGKYAAIDMNRTVAIATPMDSELAKLSVELNKTYVSYGRGGEEKAKNQMAQDANAQVMGGVAAASRASAKASHLYRNEGWDLVDATTHAGKDAKTMAADELPAEMKPMTPAQRGEYVARKAHERAEIQARIADVSKRREAYVESERKKAPAKEHSFDDAVTGAIKTEAQSAGFGF
jgi:Mg-chelatase subunit ChlD